MRLKGVFAGLQAKKWGRRCWHLLEKKVSEAKPADTTSRCWYVVLSNNKSSLRKSHNPKLQNIVIAYSRFHFSFHRNTLPFSFFY